MKNAQSPLPHSTILVVDNTAENLNVLIEYLMESGCEVAVASNGEEGLAIAGHIVPDLILLDVVMPGIDGFETCRRLKKNEVTQNIPVIFMTVLTKVEDKTKGFQAGGVASALSKSSCAIVL